MSGLSSQTWALVLFNLLPFRGTRHARGHFRKVMGIGRAGLQQFGESLRIRPTFGRGLHHRDVPTHRMGLDAPIDGLPQSPHSHMAIGWRRRSSATLRSLQGRLVQSLDQHRSGLGCSAPRPGPSVRGRRSPVAPGDVAGPACGRRHPRARDLRTDQRVESGTLHLRLGNDFHSRFPELLHFARGCSFVCCRYVWKIPLILESTKPTCRFCKLDLSHTPVRRLVLYCSSERNHHRA